MGEQGLWRQSTHCEGKQLRSGERTRSLVNERVGRSRMGAGRSGSHLADAADPRRHRTRALLLTSEYDNQC